MKKVVVILFAICVLFSCAALAESDFSGNELEISLSYRWFDMTYMNTTIDADAVFVSMDGAVLIISSTDILQDLQDAEESAMYESIIELMTDDMKQSLLKEELQTAISTFTVSGEIQTAALGDGIVGCYCSCKEGTQQYAVAKILAKREEWTMICSSQDATNDVQAALTEAMDGIQLRQADGAAQENTPSSGMSGDSSGYEIPEVPMIVHVSEEDVNVYTLDTPADGLTMSRTSLPKESVDAYVKGINASMILSPSYDDNLDYNIQIRVKDDKYSGLKSWNEASDAEIDALVNMMYGDKLDEYSLYKTEQGVFAQMKLTFDVNSLRYATIQNGDMIYIQGRKNSGPLTDDDLALLKTVVDSIEFVDAQ